MTLIWKNLTVREQETLEQITAKAKAIQRRYSTLMQLQVERSRFIEELVAVCRKCTDENCWENRDCEVKKAYLMLFGKQ